MFRVSRLAMEEICGKDVFPVARDKESQLPSARKKSAICRGPRGAAHDITLAESHLTSSRRAALRLVDPSSCFPLESKYAELSWNEMDRTTRTDGWRPDAARHASACGLLTNLLQLFKMLPQELHRALGLSDAQVDNALFEDLLDVVPLHKNFAALQTLVFVQSGGGGGGGHRIFYLCGRKQGGP